MPSAKRILPSAALVALLAAHTANAQAAAAADPNSVAFKIAQSLPYAAGQAEKASDDAVAAIKQSIASAAGIGGDDVKVTPGASVLAPDPSTKVKGTGATSVDGLPCLPRSTCYAYDVDAKFGDSGAADAFKDRLAKGSVSDLLPGDSGSSGVTVGKVAGAPAAQPRVVVLDEAKAGLGGAAKASGGGSGDAAAGKEGGSAAGAEGTEAGTAGTKGAKGGRRKLSKGAIAGIVIGSILGALLLSALAWLLCCRGRNGGTTYGGTGARAGTAAGTTGYGATKGTTAGHTSGGYGTAAGTTAGAAGGASAAAARDGRTTGQVVKETARDVRDKVEEGYDRAKASSGKGGGLFGRSGSKGAEAV